jgi:HSP20 family molecular chaperone IbpA
MSLTQRVFSDAFRDMQRAMSVFDQSFFGSAPRFFDEGTRYPTSDMVETPDSYNINAELPGYDKSNIKIELADSRTLVLSGSMSEQRETKSEGQQEESNNEQQVVKQSDAPQYWVKERVMGSFSRSFAFPTPVNPDSIEASFENGVLKVSVPKITQDQARQITID